MNLTIIGSGYVGLTTGTCFAEMGHHVICVDNNAEKIRTLQSGSIPIYEPKLEELVKKNVAVGRLEFSPSIADSIAESEVIFIAVPTPPNTDGSVDLTYIEKVAREIAQVLQPEMGYKVIVDKSTVPVKTGEKVRQTIKRYAGTDVQFDIVSNPEFLREGCAVDDLLHPDRIVIGANSERAMDVIKRVYQPIHAPILETDVNSAELIKHAANSFLALKISYINAVAKVCEKRERTWNWWRKASAWTSESPATSSTRDWATGAPASRRTSKPSSTSAARWAFPSPCWRKWNISMTPSTSTSWTRSGTACGCSRIKK